MSQPTLRFSLNPSQQAILTIKEHTSFLQHCQTNGWVPSAKEKEFYEQYIQDTHRQIKNLKKSIRQSNNQKIGKNEIDEIIAGSFTPLLNTKNYWELIHWVNSQRQQQLVEAIVPNAAKLPINYSYLSKLAAQMGLPSPSSNSTKELETLMLVIPTMNIYELNFNAYVGKESIVGGIPCICTYTVLPGLIDYFVNIFLSGMVSPDSGDMNMASNEHVIAFASKPEFVASCTSGIQALHGKFADVICCPETYFSHSHPHKARVYMDVLIGASHFVCFHEFGHLLLGHLDSEYTSQQEFDADNFAARVVLSECSDRKQLNSRIVGIMIVFNMIAILETISAINDGIHPPVLNRVQALKEVFSSVDILTVYYRIELLWGTAMDKFLEFLENKNKKKHDDFQPQCTNH